MRGLFVGGLAVLLVWVAACAPSAPPSPVLPSASAVTPGANGPATSTTPTTSSVPGSVPPAEGAARPSPGPSITLPSLPPSVDQPVPADLQPSLAAAAESYPATFADGCNVPEGGRSSRSSCLYGDLSSSVTIALFGDSHAAFWFSALLPFVQREHWRLLNLTMSSCTPADLSVYNSIFKRVYTECPAWRASAIQRLVATHPTAIVVTGTRGIDPVDSSGRQLTAPEIGPAWEAGMTRTLERLIPAAGEVILLADTPISRVDPPTCLSAHPSSVLACATEPAQAMDLGWLAAEEAVVASTGVGFIDPTRWVCPSAPCPPVLGDLLVYQNAGHLTVPFAAALNERLGDAILAQLRSRGIALP